MSRLRLGSGARGLVPRAGSEAALGETRRARPRSRRSRAASSSCSGLGAGAQPAPQRRRAARSSASPAGRAGSRTSGRESSSPVITGSGSLSRICSSSSSERPRSVCRRRGAQNSWFSPPKTSATESSVKMRRIDVGQQVGDRQHRDVVRRAGRSGIVSVTTICSNGLAARFSNALPDSTGCVAAAKTRVRALVLDRLGRGAQRARGVDDVVDDHRRLVLHVADHVGDLGDLLGGALLVEDRQLGADLLGELLAPASRGRRPGETTTRSSSCWSRKYCVRMNIAVMWSTGF